MSQDKWLLQYQQKPEPGKLASIWSEKGFISNKDLLAEVRRVLRRGQLVLIQISPWPLAPPQDTETKPHRD